MSANQENIEHLNKTLKNALTAINQYFLHARMLKHQGLMKLADYEYQKSIEQMRFSDKLVERVLHLGGMPNLQDLGTLFIGNDANSILRNDLKLEEVAESILQNAIAACEAKNDASSLDILRAMQKQSATHNQFIHAQLNLIDSMSVANYLQTQAA